MTSSVSAFLEDLGMRPNQCPFCRCESLVIRHDDLLARCGNDLCRRYFSPRGIPGPDIYGEELCASLRRALLDDSSTVKLLTEQHGLHRDVIADSLVGVVPEGIDIEQVFAGAVTAAEQALAAADRPSGPGRPRKDDAKAAAANRLAAIQEERDAAALALSQRAGWLAFFYTDATHQITQAALVEPDTGCRLSLPLKAGGGGLFNHGLFAAPEPSRCLHEARERLILMSAELDVLKLQSYAARRAGAESLSAQHGYLWAAATGPAKLVDAETIRHLTRVPVFLRASEHSRAQNRIVANLTERTSLDVTAPDSGERWPDAFANESFDLPTALRNITRFHRPVRAVKNELDDIRRLAGKQMQAHLARRWAADVLVRDIEDRGALYHDGREAYVFLKQDAELLLVDPDDERLRLVLMKYGMLPTDEVFKTAVTAIRLAATQRGKATTVHSFSHYDRTRGCVYLFDQKENVYRISSTTIDRVANGTDDALFRKSCKTSKFTIALERYGEQCQLGQILLEGVRVRENFLSRREQEQLVETWALAMLFPVLFPTRPILALVGEKGSGKTSVGRALGRIYFGRDFQVIALEGDERDCDAAITSEHYAVLDNADCELRWIEDKLAVVATGGAIKRRRYYTTNQLVEYPITAFVAITSRTPHFRREDVADRLLVIEVERLPQFESESVRLERLDSRRDEIMTSVARRVQEILKAFAANGGKQFKTEFRMADFADFAFKGTTSDGAQKELAATLARLMQQQLAFTTEGEPLFELLDSWLENKANVGKLVTAAQLFADLGDLARSSIPPLTFGFKSVRAFGHALTNVAGTLRTLYGATVEAGRSRMRYWRFAHGAERPLPDDPHAREQAA
jgi:hypothetical protein